MKKGCNQSRVCRRNYFSFAVTLLNVANTWWRERMVALVGGGISMHEKLCDCETLEKRPMSAREDHTGSQRDSEEDGRDTGAVGTFSVLNLSSCCGRIAGLTLMMLCDGWIMSGMSRCCSENVRVSPWKKETDTRLYEGSCLHHVGGQHAPLYHLRHCGRWLQLRLPLCSLR